MSSQQKDGDRDAGDNRMMLATGPFSMLPGDTAVVAIAFTFALPSAGTEANGKTEDIQGLVSKVRTLRDYYNSVLTTSSVYEYVDTETEALIAPQPVSSDAILQIKSDEEKNISAELYSALGEKISSLYQGIISNETKFIPFSASALPSGLYFVKITSEKNSQAIPLTVVH